MKKSCSCGRSFITSNPAHDCCRSCHRGRVRAAEARVKSAQLQREQAAERDVMRDALRQALLARQLPKSATVRGDRNQVTVAWMGRSHTFHLPSSAFM